jgi:hypothetical protein
MGSKDFISGIGSPEALEQLILLREKGYIKGGYSLIGVGRDNGKKGHRSK